MRHQVDQHVDPVGGDALRGGEVVGRRQADVGVEGGAKARGHRVRVLRRRQRVGEELEPAAVVRGEHLLQQAAHHVVAEVRGQVADPQPARRGAVARAPRGERGAAGAARLLQPIVGAVEREEGFARHVEVLQPRHHAGHEDRIAGNVRPFLRQRQVARDPRLVALLDRGDEARADEPCRGRGNRLEGEKILPRVVVPRERQQAAAQREPDVLVGRRQRTRSLEVGQREVVALLRGERQREVAERLRRIRRPRQCPLEVPLRVGVAEPAVGDPAQRERCRRPAGTQPLRRGEGALGVGVGPDVERQHAEVVMQVGAARRQRDRLAVRGHRGIGAAGRGGVGCGRQPVAQRLHAAATGASWTRACRFQPYRNHA